MQVSYVHKYVHPFQIKVNNIIYIQYYVLTELKPYNIPS